MSEIAHGLTGTGTYRMWEGYPVCDVSFPTSQLLLKLDDIVATVQKPPAYSAESLPYNLPVEWSTDREARDMRVHCCGPVTQHMGCLTVTLLNAAAPERNMLGM